MKQLLTALLAVTCAIGGGMPAAGAQPAAAHPLMRDFIGLNVHTVLFKPDLYKPVCIQLRDYHPMEWDLGKQTAVPPPFPEARNRVNWSSLYGGWQKSGYQIDATLMLGSIKPSGWQDRLRDIETYGRLVGQCFGPGGAWPVLKSVEVGNEPHEYTPDEYREMFKAMATGIRAANPKLPIVTCALRVNKPDKYNKPVQCVEGLNDLYDVLNVHTYALAERWPRWRRSYPEDPKIEYVTDVQDMIDWRNAHAPGKPVWITEFGYDSSSKPSPTEGPNKGFVQVTDLQQAQWIIRSFLVFSSMDLQRAYLYWFNDDDRPSFHACSGITRKYKPKPSFYAMSQLSATLGDYRFAGAIRRDDVYAFDYQHNTRPQQRVVVVWLPTGSGRQASVRVRLQGKVISAVAMQLSNQAPGQVPFQQAGDGTVTLEAAESVVYLTVGP